jgi:hypothetical protein
MLKDENTLSVKSWRDQLPAHPVPVTLMPARTPGERATLIADLLRNGVRLPPVLLFADGQLFMFDGATRLDCAEEAGAEITFANGAFTIVKAVKAITSIPAPHVIVYEPGLDLHSLALSYNLHSRPWTAEKKAHVVAALIKANLGRSDRQIATMALVSHTTVSQLRAKLEAKGDVATSCHVTDTRGRRQPRVRKRVSATSVAPIAPSAIAKRAPAPTPAYPPAPSKSNESALRRRMDKMVEFARQGLALSQRLAGPNCEGVRHKFHKIIEAATDAAPRPAPEVVLDLSQFGKAMGFAPIVANDPGPLPEFLDRRVS